ncbi:MAG: protein phosphatase 2C domain-containing protein [Gammaproteobacteria bacterium]
MASSDVLDVCSGTAVVFSRRSPDKTSFNEDTAAIIRLGNDAALLMVADGVGGLPAGARASYLVIDIIHKAVKTAYNNGEDLRHAILSAVEKANERIISNADGSATTLAIAEIHKNRIRTYHVGDSMIMITGQRGKLKMETISHSPVGYAVEAGVLSQEEAIIHDERHIVSNVVGAQNMHISMGIPTTLAARDTLLVASDGLFDNIHQNEIIEIIRKGNLEDCSNTLAATAGKRMEDGVAPFKPDDLTFMLFRLSKAGAKRI